MSDLIQKRLIRYEQNKHFRTFDKFKKFSDDLCESHEGQNNL